MTTEERLEKVEQELKETKAGLTASKHRSHWMLGGVALLILGCLTIAATPGDYRIIRANGFILEDENGKTRVMMGVSKDGLAQINMLDESGKIRIQMEVDENGPVLSMKDENSKPRTMMSVGKDGPALCMKDKNCKILAQMNVDENGPGIIIRDADKKIIWKTP